MLSAASRHHNSPRRHAPAHTMEDATITLFNFGPAFGLPDSSPFVIKTEILLKMANLSYRTANSGLRAAPKGKIPYFDDDGEIVADSTFIRRKNMASTSTLG
jgi:hypothetical protein